MNIFTIYFVYIKYILYKRDIRITAHTIFGALEHTPIRFLVNCAIWCVLEQIFS